MRVEEAVTDTRWSNFLPRGAMWREKKLLTYQLGPPEAKRDGISPRNPKIVPWGPCRSESPGTVRYPSSFGRE
jgi:hypothetical protein